MQRHPAPVRSVAFALVGTHMSLNEETDRPLRHSIAEVSEGLCGRMKPGRSASGSSPGGSVRTSERQRLLDGPSRHRDGIRVSYAEASACPRIRSSSESSYRRPPALAAGVGDRAFQTGSARPLRRARPARNDWSRKSRRRRSMTGRRCIGGWPTTSGQGPITSKVQVGKARANRRIVSTPCHGVCGAPTRAGPLQERRASRRADSL